MSEPAQPISDILLEALAHLDALRRGVHRLPAPYRDNIRARVRAIGPARFAADMLQRAAPVTGGFFVPFIAPRSVIRAIESALVKEAKTIDDGQSRCFVKAHTALGWAALVAWQMKR